MNWNARYASEMDEETLNRLMPSTSAWVGDPHVSDGPATRNSYRTHRLDRPVGNIHGITTFVIQSKERAFGHASLLWPENDDTLLFKHFDEEPIDLPNKADPHHPDNHAHILHRVKSFLARKI